MKKFFAFIGLAAAGTASLHATYAPDLGPMESTKDWSVSATLRGFYDSDYTTASTPQGSYGFEFSPSIDINVPLQQTELGLKYTYGLYYYQERESLNQNPIDQTHQLDLWIDHAFTERWQAKVEDSLVVAQEPQLLDPLLSVVTRTEGNNVANTGTITLNTDWTRLLSTVFTYQNQFFDYQNSGGTTNNPSLAGALNRIQHSISIDFDWHITPVTVALFGYQFGLVNYIGGEPIAPGYVSDNRDSLSHTAYLGVESEIIPNLSLAAKVGGQYTDNYNDPMHTTSLNPYANITLTYTYLPGSYAQLGFIETRNATDQIQYNASNHSITLDQESSSFYGSINHQLTPYLLASLIGQIQYSTFNGGAINSQSETYYGVGASLTYNFNPHISAQIGYNFDDVETKVSGLGYTRHRVYIGITGAY